VCSSLVVMSQAEMEAGVCGGAVRRGGRGGGGITRASPGGVGFDSFLPLLFRQSSQAVEASSSTVPSTA
jgi:hypothetical protein